MARKRNPLLFLTDILKVIEKIEVRIQSGKKEFFENETIQDATLFRLQTAMQPPKGFSSSFNGGHDTSATDCFTASSYGAISGGQQREVNSRLRLTYHQCPLTFSHYVPIC